jgi:hypothetical protein
MPPNNANDGLGGRRTQTEQTFNRRNYAAGPTIPQACEHLRLRVLYFGPGHVHFAQVACHDCGGLIRYLPRLLRKRARNRRGTVSRNSGAT